MKRHSQVSRAKEEGNILHIQAESCNLKMHEYANALKDVTSGTLKKTISSENPYKRNDLLVFRASYVVNENGKSDPKRKHLYQLQLCKYAYI